MSSVFNKYGVPGEDGNIEAPIQPKLQYRFKVMFTGFGAATDSFALTKNIIDVTVPNFTQEPVAIDTYVSKYYVIGKHTIGNLTLTLRNDANNLVGGLIQAQLDRQHNAYHQSHAPTAGAVKFGAKIMFLNGSNGAAEWPQGGGEGAAILEGWHITGCWLESVEWGQLAYSSSEPNQISLTIRPDNAFHVVDQSSLGSSQDVSYTNSSALTSFDFTASASDSSSAT